jgi:hypothetical protein
MKFLTPGFGRIDISSVTNIPAGKCSPHQVTMLRRLGHTAKLPIVIETGFDAETFQPRLTILHNGHIVEAAQQAGLEMIDAWIATDQTEAALLAEM